LFNEPTRVAFLDNLPQLTANLSADYEIGKWAVTAQRTALRRLDLRGEHFGHQPGLRGHSCGDTFFDLVGHYDLSRASM
jgi:hypothetical protein